MAAMAAFRGGEHCRVVEIPLINLDPYQPGSCHCQGDRNLDLDPGDQIGDRVPKSQSFILKLIT